MFVKGELPSAGDFTFNNTSGEYTGKTLTIEDMGLEGKTDAANAILSMSDQAKYHELAKAIIDYGNAVQIGLGYDSPDNSKPADFSEYTVTVNGEQVEAKSANGAASSANWYVEVEKIQGKNYDKEYEVKLTKKGVETPLVLKASVLSYAKLLTEQASAAYKILGKGMYSYCLAEKKTFNS